MDSEKNNMSSLISVDYADLYNHILSGKDHLMNVNFMIIYYVCEKFNNLRSLDYKFNVEKHAGALHLNTLQMNNIIKDFISFKNNPEMKEKQTNFIADYPVGEEKPVVEKPKVYLDNLELTPKVLKFDVNYNFEDLKKLFKLDKVPEELIKFNLIVGDYKVLSAPWFLKQIKKCKSFNCMYYQAVCLRKLMLFELLESDPKALLMPLKSSKFILREKISFHNELNFLFPQEDIMSIRKLNKKEEIFRRMKLFSPIFKALWQEDNELQDMFITGSILEACYVDKESNHKMPFTKVLDTYYTKSDLDILINRVTPAEFENKLQILLNILTKANIKFEYEKVKDHKYRIKATTLGNDKVYECDFYMVSDVYKVIRRHHLASVRLLLDCTTKKFYTFPTGAYAFSSGICYKYNIYIKDNTDYVLDILLKNYKRGYTLVHTNCNIIEALNNVTDLDKIWNIEKKNIKNQYTTKFNALSKVSA